MQFLTHDEDDRIIFVFMTIENEDYDEVQDDDCNEYNIYFDKYHDLFSPTGCQSVMMMMIIRIIFFVDDDDDHDNDDGQGFNSLWPSTQFNLPSEW